MKSDIPIIFENNIKFFFKYINIFSLLKVAIGRNNKIFFAWKGPLKILCQLVKIKNTDLSTF